MTMTRKDLQKLARIRLKEARVLLMAECYEGSYHLTGLGVECVLKACIAKLTNRHDFPDKKFVDRIYTHKLPELLGLAGLESDLDDHATQYPVFARHWAALKGWDVNSRYELISEERARDLYQAATTRQGGILSWLKQHW